MTTVNLLHIKYNINYTVATLVFDNMSHASFAVLLMTKTKGCVPSVFKIAARIEINILARHDLIRNKEVYFWTEMFHVVSMCHVTCGVCRKEL